VPARAWNRGHRLAAYRRCSADQAEDHQRKGLNRMEWMTRVLAIVSVALVVAGVYSYERSEAYDRAFRAVNSGGTLANPQAQQAKADIATGYARLSGRANELASYCAMVLIGLGLLQVIVSVLFRKRPGASMWDYGVVSIACGLLVGMVLGSGASPAAVAVVAGVLVAGAFARRVRAGRI
jgi:hypothetical protein